MSMESESATFYVSTALYQYLCQNIVGSEEHVKTIRMMNTVRDHYQSNEKCIMITSGSFGEGLEMRGSDIDIMLVRNDMEITPAKPWIIRSNKSWPKYDLKQAIVTHGVLFVPIGVPGSSQEDLEWRISFSVGEKLLLYSFTHTQLQCYALLKILLKDVIALDRECKDLLCSYFMKTILFWVCEELPLSIWKPENLIFGFMRCFRRLIYCVEYGVCLHYFIPENNLFENKIHGHEQETLLNKLYILNSYDWQCILFSDQISRFFALTYNINMESCYLHINSVEKFIISTTFRLDNIDSNYEFLLKKGIYKLLFCESSKIKHLYTFYVSNYCCKFEDLLPSDDRSGNKSNYEDFNTYTNTLLLNIRPDAVSGWLMLASFFYKRKQFSKALYIVQYSISKCSQEQIHIPMNISDIHNELLSLHLYRKMTVVQFWRYLLLDYVMFDEDSLLIPTELEMEVHCVLPPVVYAHFLRFLCHYHLQNSWQFRDSLRGLQLTIQENSRIPGANMKSKCYNILGICFQLLGDTGSARKAFVQSKELFPDEKNNTAFQRLSIIG
ncbi:uncharacterized protein LOC134698095 [Mytilus trossulus]|uniref:uncharacterized protein LOC134698095 n=1 Tax=Mytilus trossulus TaxID=6551 RepID=UPI003005692C